MMDAFLVDVQIKVLPLAVQLEQWVMDCADLQIGDGQQVCQLHLWDWAKFESHRQANKNLPAGLIVFSDVMDHKREQQVLVYGAQDYICPPFSLRNVILRLSLHVQRLQYMAKLESLSVTDTLTGLFNRRKFNQDLDNCWRQAQRLKTECSLLLIDVDHFKAFNDHYGHLAGDQCLRELSKVFQAEAIRPLDNVARIGGEEFAMILPLTPKGGAMHVAQRVIKRVTDLQILNKNTQRGYVSISIGLATIIPTKADKIEAWQQRADDALYLAKEQGRNRVVAEMHSAPFEAEIF